MGGKAWSREERVAPGVPWILHGCAGLVAASNAEEIVPFAGSEVNSAGEVWPSWWRELGAAMAASRSGRQLRLRRPAAGGALRGNVEFRLCGLRSSLIPLRGLGEAPRPADERGRSEIEDWR